MTKEWNWMLLIKRLANQKKESETVEFKHNNPDASMIGQDIAALANMAALMGEEKAYMVWGVADSSFDLVGTDFSPNKTKVGNEDLGNWLSTQLQPRLFIDFHEVTDGDKKYVVLEVEKSRGFVTSFKKVPYCRVGSYTKPLKDFPLIEKKLWAKLNDAVAEERLVAFDLSENEVASLLSFGTYFKVLGTPVPSTLEEMLRRLTNDDMVKKQEDGLYSITLMGALLLANDLAAFPSLGRKQITITLFEGESKIQNRESKEFKAGYLLSFEEAVSYLKSFTLQRTYVNGNGYTVSSYFYPDIVLREGLTNAIIHQDLLERGAGPMVNITSSFIEFVNPGALKISPDHIIDAEPIAENEKLSSFLRRAGIGDARGTGFDKIENALEEAKMLSPSVHELSGSVSVYVHALKPFSQWTLDEKLSAAYYHACLFYYSAGKAMTNETLRERFGLNAKEKSTVSRIIRVAVERGMLKVVNVGASDKNRSYVPYWA